MNDAHDLRPVDLNLLVAFRTLYEVRSVTRAGQLLGVTQSAMSHTLRRLRDLTGDRLFVRDGRRLASTPRADAMIQPVRSALATLARAVREPETFRASTSTRTFTLASIDLFDRVLLPDVLRRMRADGPGIGLTVVPHGRPTVEALHTGEIDAAIHPVLEGAEPLPASGLVRRTLFREGFKVLVREDHPADLTNLDAYCAADHLVVSPSGAGPTLVDHRLQALGRARRIAVRMPRFSATLDLVACTDLVLTAPATLGALAPPGLRVVDAPVELPDHAITLLWSERFSDDPAHRWFRAQFDVLRGA